MSDTDKDPSAEAISRRSLLAASVPPVRAWQRLQPVQASRSTRPIA